MSLVTVPSVSSSERSHNIVESIRLGRAKGLSTYCLRLRTI